VEQTEISAAEWQTYCTGFSREHHGWLITLVTIATADLEEAPEQVESHWQVIADQVHFQELDLEEKGGYYDVVIQTGKGDSSIKHRASHVRSLVVLQR
jgi:hypothetical protein